MKNLPLVVLVIWLYSCNGQASTPPPATGIMIPQETSLKALPANELRQYKNEVTQFVDSTFGNGRFNGCILVAKNGEVIYEKYQGFRNPRLRRDSINSSTAFHLASVSKTFTAMSILKLQEEGKLNIHDLVSKYLTGFPLPGVTIKSLMDHRSGIPNYVHYMERLGWDRKKIITNQDVLDFIIARHKDIQIGPPDRHFSYSNTNFALLALIAEKVSGLPFPQFLKVTFFDPLEMNDTYVYTLSDSARSLASYYASGRLYPFEYLDRVYGDKNVYTTARDMLKWDQALYGNLFQKQTLDSAFSGYSFEKPGINNYGLGWRMFNLKNGRKFIYHNGWWHGNRTAFYRLIDDKVTIIAFSNNDYTKVYSCKKLADIFGNYFKNAEDERQSTETISTVKEASPEP